MLGAGHSTMAATLDSTGAQPSLDNRKPKNSTSDRKSSVFEPLIKSSCTRNVSKTALSLWRCSAGSSEFVNISTSSQYIAIYYTVVTCDVVTQHMVHQPLKTARCVCQAKRACHPFILSPWSSKCGFKLIPLAYPQLVEARLEV